MNFSAQARKKRAKLFKNYFKISKNTKILDLVSENGTNIFNVLQGTNFNLDNVYIADIDTSAIEEGKNLYGFSSILINETGNLPFTDNYFDIVYSSSVIEHTTVEKSDLWNWKKK